MPSVDHLRSTISISALMSLATSLCLLLVAGCDRSGKVDSRDSTAAAESSADPRPNASVSEPTSSPLFADVAHQLGIDFVHDPGAHKDPYFMPRSIGSGAAFFDYDGDGRLDLYLVQNGGEKAKSTCRLYHQDKSGKFVDVTAGSGLDVHGRGMGVAAGDINNDGKVDLILSEYGRSRLFLNRSDGAKPSFDDISEAAGIDNAFWGTSCSFVDYNRDGWLDLLIVNYVDYDPSRWCFDNRGRHEFCGPDNFPGRPTKLYRNLGAAGLDSSHPNAPRFADETATSHLATSPGPGLGVFCADFNADRWPDIFIANDGKPNHLWINQQDGTFKEEALQSGIATNAMGKAEANMGIAIGDVDGNGLFDVFVTHLTTETHSLWAQGPRGFFQDKTVAMGITSTWRSTGFGSVMADFDNDGAVDLAIANGRIDRGPKMERYVAGVGDFWRPYCERNHLLINDGQGRFRDISESNEPFCGEAAVSRGLACADFDNDGTLDLLVTRVAAPVALYRNVAKTHGHWLTVQAIDPALHRDAYGAEVYLTVGQNKRMQWINPGYSYLCSNDPRAHFGLGTVDHYDSLAVVWPDGTEEQFPGGRADRIVVLQRGEGTPVESVKE
jgi:hypothetical protein